MIHFRSGIFHDHNVQHNKLTHAPSTSSRPPHFYWEYQIVYSVRHVNSPNQHWPSISHLHIFLGALFDLVPKSLKLLLILLQTHHVLVNHCRELSHLGAQQSCVTFRSLPTPPIPLLY